MKIVFMNVINKQSDDGKSSLIGVGEKRFLFINSFILITFAFLK